MFKDIREVWGRYAPVMTRELVRFCEVRWSLGSLRSSYDPRNFLRPISFKPKPYQNDETTL